MVLTSMAVKTIIYQNFLHSIIALGLKLKVQKIYIGKNEEKSSVALVKLLFFIALLFWAKYTSVDGLTIKMQISSRC